MANNRRRLFIKLEHKTNRALDLKRKLIESIIYQLNRDLKEYFCHIEMLIDGDDYEGIDEVITGYLLGVKGLLNAESLAKVRELHFQLVLVNYTKEIPLGKRVRAYSYASRYKELNSAEFMWFIHEGYLGAVPQIDFESLEYQ